MQKATQVGEDQVSRTNLRLRFLKVDGYIGCPVETSTRHLGVLRKKWAALILLSIASRRQERFNQILEALHGISPRILATRLKELEEANLIEKVEERRSNPMIVRWGLTDKGLDVFPVLMMLAAYGSKWHADEVFQDKKPRKLNELFDHQAIQIIQEYF
jgi:DNA-binding HxlR family transcriptional regulator